MYGKFIRIQKKIQKKISQISRIINLTVENLLFAMGFSMAILVAVQVFFRYVLNYSLFWSEELARYLLVWLTFLGASVAYHKNLHPGVDAIYVRMGKIPKKISFFLVHFLSLFLFAIMIFFGIKFAWFVRLQISPALAIPKWIIFSVIPVSGLILLIHSINFIVTEAAANNNDN